MARQSGMMAQQISHRDAIGRDGVVQAEFRDVIPQGLLPIKQPLVRSGIREKFSRWPERVMDCNVACSLIGAPNCSGYT
jgi:hypothetical protein